MWQIDVDYAMASLNNTKVKKSKTKKHGLNEKKKLVKFWG